jgi:glycosyltransferase involved in cell wall biosynthesis
LQVTEAYESQLNTGIQRVVKRLAQEIANLNQQSLVLLRADRSDRARAIEISLDEFLGKNKKAPSQDVVFENQIYKRLAEIWNKLSSRGLKKFLDSPAMQRLAHNVIQSIYKSETKAAQPKYFEFCRGDQLYVIDSFWSIPDGIKLLQSAKKSKAKVVVLLNDIFPVTHPEFVDAGNIKRFKTLVSEILKLADGLLYPSDVTKRDLEKQYFPKGIKIPHGKLDYGSNPSTRQSARTDPSALGKPLRIPNSIIAVGTVEPRKNYDQIFQWFLNRGRFDKNLTVIGKPGWLTDELQTQMRFERGANPNFRWIENATDEELLFEMQRHELGIMASHAEGLGLPVIEMAKQGLKLVLSDIPIFREVAGDAAEYFPLGSLEGLDEAISRALVTSAPKEVTLYTWEDTAKQLLEFSAILADADPERQSKL